MEKRLPQRKPIEPRQRGKNGSTIVEALISLIIFAVFVTGACQLLLSHRRLTDQARAHYTAANIAKNRLELIRSFPYGQVESFIENNIVIDANGAVNPRGHFRRSTKTFSTGRDNLMELSVTVEIRDRVTLGFEGTQQELSTLFADYLTEDSSVGGGVSSDSTS